MVRWGVSPGATTSIRSKNGERRRLVNKSPPPPRFAGESSVLALINRAKRSWRGGNRFPGECVAHRVCFSCVGWQRHASGHAVFHIVREMGRGFMHFSMPRIVEVVAVVVRTAVKSPCKCRVTRHGTRARITTVGRLIAGLRHHSPPASTGRMGDAGLLNFGSDSDLTAAARITACVAGTRLTRRATSSLRGGTATVGSSDGNQS